MSSEEFEKLHEIYRSLYEELKLVPERALRCQGGKQFRLAFDANISIRITGRWMQVTKHFCFCRGEEAVGEDLRWEAGGGGGSGELVVTLEVVFSLVLCQQFCFPTEIFPLPVPCSRPSSSVSASERLPELLENTFRFLNSLYSSRIPAELTPGGK